MNPQSSQEALAQLQQIQSQAQNPSDILANQRQQLGVNAAQDTVTGLRGAINNTTKLLKQVAPSVMGRTANSLVTSAQAGKQIQNEQAPISQTLTDQNSQYNQQTEDLNNLQQKAQEAASGIYQGQQDKLSYAQNLYNMLFQKEQAAQAAAQAEADRQEQIRQFNAQLALNQQKAASSGGSSFNLPGAGSNAPSSASGGGASISQQLYNQVKNMLSHDPNSIKSEFNAITTSAGYGNQSDVQKLKLLYDLNPGLFNGRAGALRLIGLG